MTLAIIKTGGKQYLVKAGDKIKVEKIKGEKGDKVKLDTLLTTEEDGSKLEVGKPLLKSQVDATILEQGRNDKITVVKYKNKIRYKKTTGHRQQFTKLQIDKI